MKLVKKMVLFAAGLIVCTAVAPMAPAADSAAAAIRAGPLLAVDDPINFRARARGYIMAEAADYIRIWREL